MSQLNNLTNLHWLTAMVLFSVYGVQVCPFLESQTVIQLLIPIVCAFSLSWLLRRARLGQTTELNFARELFNDWGLSIGAGLFIAAYNFYFFASPLDSNLKVLGGMTALGFYVACDLALTKERLLKRSQANAKPGLGVGKRLSLFAGCSAAILALVIFLVINKDLDWLVMVGSQRYPIELAQRYILTEIAFVVLVVFGYVARVIYSYSSQVQHLLDNQLQSLDQVQAGRLDTQVAILSNDEFGRIASKTNTMIGSLRERSLALHQTRDIAIHSLASLAETRDNETGAHILRTKYYVKALAEQLATYPKYQQSLSPEQIDLIYKSAPLHDIGKVGIPDAVLLKPGKLNDEEWQIMRQHPQIGADALDAAEQEFASQDTAFLAYAKEISLYHHEKWGGSGYPHGLEGEAIPLSARLMALADVYDALISKRVYKPAFSHEQAKQIILEGSGQHFDPAVVNAFVAVEQEFVAIAERYQDKEHLAA